MCSVLHRFHDDLWHIVGLPYCTYTLGSHIVGVTYCTYTLGTVGSLIVGLVSWWAVVGFVMVFLFSLALFLVYTHYLDCSVMGSLSFPFPSLHAAQALAMWMWNMNRKRDGRSQNLVRSKPVPPFTNSARTVNKRTPPLTLHWYNFKTLPLTPTLSAFMQIPNETNICTYIHGTNFVMWDKVSCKFNVVHRCSGLGGTQRAKCC